MFFFQTELIFSFFFFFFSLGNTSDMTSVTGDLRTVLERCLSEDASPEVMDTFMPEVRHVLFRLLRGLKTQHESWQTARRRPK